MVHTITFRPDPIEPNDETNNKCQNKIEMKIIKIYKFADIQYSCIIKIDFIVIYYYIGLQDVTRLVIYILKTFCDTLTVGKLNFSIFDFYYYIYI